MSMVILSEDEARVVRALLLDLQGRVGSEDRGRISDVLPSLRPPKQRALAEQMRERLASSQTP